MAVVASRAEELRAQIGALQEDSPLLADLAQQVPPLPLPRPYTNLPSLLAAANPLSERL